MSLKVNTKLPSSFNDFHTQCVNFITMFADLFCIQSTNSGGIIVHKSIPNLVYNS